MSDLVEFLRARLDEDRQAAQAALDADKMFVDDGGFTIEYRWARITIHQSGGRGTGFASGAPSPARVLREGEAKRQIIEPHKRADWFVPDADQTGACIQCSKECDENGHLAIVAWPCPTLRALAAVYSDHCDYQQEWSL
ncbi:hypothetical protein GS921_00335 [Rhodococcus hoagii]|nr:hypothetical protein [Prescottella equi]